MEPMEQNQNETALVAASEQNALVDVEKKQSGYWARVSRRYKWLSRIVAISLVLFILLFVTTWSDAFSYENVLYFGKDMGNLATLALKDESAIYYTYGKAGASVVSYRGGVGMVHCGGTEIYTPDGELLLFLEGDYKNPRAAVSRDYFITYDFGGNSYTVCNSYVELYRGTTEYPIYNVSVSDAGYYALVTAPEATDKGVLPLCEVLVFTPSFQLVKRFGRAGATVAAALSENGRFVAIADATAAGATVDIFTVGTDRHNATLTFSDFPYMLSFTSDSTLALACQKTAFTFNVEGELYGQFHYNGAVLHDVDMGTSGVALVLFDNQLSNVYRLVVMDIKGNLLCNRGTLMIKDLSLIDDHVWLLDEDEVTCYALSRDVFVYQKDVSANAVAIHALSKSSVQVIYPSQTIKV